MKTRNFFYLFRALTVNKGPANAFYRKESVKNILHLSICSLHNIYSINFGGSGGSLSMALPGNMISVEVP